MYIIVYNVYFCKKRKYLQWTKSCFTNHVYNKKKQAFHYEYEGKVFLQMMEIDHDRSKSRHLKSSWIVSKMIEEHLPNIPTFKCNMNWEATGAIFLLLKSMKDNLFDGPQLQWTYAPTWYQQNMSSSLQALQYQLGLVYQTSFTPSPLWYSRKKRHTCHIPCRTAWCRLK